MLCSKLSLKAIKIALEKLKNMAYLDRANNIEMNRNI